ncbi:MAG TPA: D-2-hydroxyacid dehydrogenase [Candidatus Limnocylindria bacterium]|nr:D-2-hydroxyacid dehydrogenase [Candidatus Limnocylindria bacterium]
MAPLPTVLVVLRPNRAMPPGLLEKTGHLAHFEFAVGADEVGPAAERADVVFVWNFRSRLVPEVFHRLPRLRWVHVAAVGVDASLSPEVAASDVVVTNSRGVTANAMAEYALTLMLLFAKDIRPTLADQAAARWNPRLTKLMRGACLVVVGVGAVNRRLARVAHAMGMRVIGVGRTAHPADEGFERIVGQEELVHVLPEADYVVVATPLTADTDGMMGTAAIAAMKRDAILVNVGRGAVIDESALVEALRERRIGGAALDVVWREPLEPEHPLWTMPNVILSPHMSADFTLWQEGMVNLFAANLERWRAGAPLHNVVDKALGYVPSEVGVA